jgi:circadian clock protein KaiB
VSTNILDGQSRLPQHERIILRLYIAGATPLSSRAIANLKTICETYLPGRYDFTVVDLCEEKERAREDQILVAPTLVRHQPLPMRRVIGDLSHTARVLAALGITPAGLCR